MRRALAGIAAVGLALSGVGVAQAAPSDAGERAAYIVRFVDGVNIGAEVAAAKRGGAEVTGSVSRIFPAFFASMTSAQASALARNPRVAAVEIDGVVTTTSTTTQTSTTWGIDRIDQRALPLNRSYTYGANGAGVRAYILDTGVRVGHTEFTGRMAPGYTAINDGEGTNDCNGHGTHVAGTVAGTVYGVAKAATVVPVRVLGCDGSGSMSGVVAGMDWVVGNHDTNVAGVVNMSLGGGVNSSVDAGVDRLTRAGIVVVVAAGNSNANACNYSPARAPSAITVGATTSTDARASYSNIGSCLDLFAPGSSITSAWHTSTTAAATISGTSMASPHVAGVVAVLQSGGSQADRPVAELIVANATPGVVTSQLRGSPNLLLYSPPPTVATVPAAPTVIATRGNASATVDWSSNGNGGSSITGYTVTVSPPGGTVAPFAPLATSTTISGLSNGTTYTVSVTATNSVGASAAGTAAVTPATVPGAPEGVTATASNASASIQWAPPDDTGGSAISTYSVTLAGGATPLTQQVSGLSANFTNLVNGAQYTVTVLATNAVGPGPGSLGITVTPTAPPSDPGGGTSDPDPPTLSAPTNVSALGRNGSLAISWGYTGTLAPSSYRAEVWTSSLTDGVRVGTCSTTSLSCSVNKLTNGTTYSVRVFALSATDFKASNWVEGTPRR